MMTLNEAYRIVLEDLQSRIPKNTDPMVESKIEKIERDIMEMCVEDKMDYDATVELLESFTEDELVSLFETTYGQHMAAAGISLRSKGDTKLDRKKQDIAGRIMNKYFDERDGSEKRKTQVDNALSNLRSDRIDTRYDRMDKGLKVSKNDKKEERRKATFHEICIEMVLIGDIRAPFGALYFLTDFHTSNTNPNIFCEEIRDVIVWIRY